jgi:hypothetical protein
VELREDVLDRIDEIVPPGTGILAEVAEPHIPPWATSTSAAARVPPDHGHR